MESFNLWLESIVKFKDINDAIKKTLEFVVDNGVWKFERNPHGLSGIKTVTVAGHFYCEKGHFFLTANTVAEKSIDNYDAITGDIDSNSKIEIIAGICIINDIGPFKLKKIAERSNVKGGRLHTPYELAIWTKEVIDNYSDDDDDNSRYEDSPMPSNSKLVTV